MTSDFHIITGHAWRKYGTSPRIMTRKTLWWRWIWSALHNGAKSYVTRSWRTSNRCTWGRVTEKDRPWPLVFCINADGSHKLPMRYFWKWKKHRCFADNNAHEYEQYWSLKNDWMDSAGFIGSIMRCSNIYNCDGHESEFAWQSPRGVSTPSYNIKSSGFEHGFNISK